MGDDWYESLLHLSLKTSKWEHSPVEDVVGFMEFISDGRADTSQCGLPEVRESLHPMEVGEDDVKILQQAKYTWVMYTTK